MSNIMLMEPASIKKRRGYADSLVKYTQPKSLDISTIKNRIKEIRLDSIRNMRIYQDRLMSQGKGKKSLDVSSAPDAHAAVSIIKSICSNEPVAINKSAVITNELRHLMLKSGLDVIETYYDELKPFDNQFNIYKQLPDQNVSSIFNSFQISDSLDSSRDAHIKKHGGKNFTGLIGVNAVSAEDGSIIMLQHLGNIKTILNEARRIIFVVGLDKIVKNRDDAIFQTRSMAAFGWDALPRPKVFYNHPKNGISIQQLKSRIPFKKTDQKVYMILLDNGRSDLTKSHYAGLLECIGCRACTKSCPASEYFQKESRWNPREYLTYFVKGKNKSLSRCLQCRTCRMHCPLDINIPDMILNARADEFKKERLKMDTVVFSKIDKLMFLGSKTPEISNQLAKNKIIRNIGEKLFNISSLRILPKFEKVSFMDWMKKNS